MAFRLIEARELKTVKVNCKLNRLLTDSLERGSYLVECMIFVRRFFERFLERRYFPPRMGGFRDKQ